jgi:protocatechuate 3,4-dioxygenase, beta subunit
MARLPLPRRHLLAASMAGAGALLLSGPTRALAALLPTPQQTTGPFYPETLPADADNDLLHVAGRGEPARGVPTQIAGRVLDRNGRPLSGARVEIWQCDANGRYHHVRDGGADRARDQNFQGFGQTVTDATGAYRFLTIRPVPYPGRTPHIHFAVSARGVPRFVTQMYVAGEPGNERDALLLGIGDPAARARVVVPLEQAPDVGPGGLAGRFDIVLGEAAG